MQVTHLTVNRHYRRTSQRGFTLLEALIAFTVLSFGVLGIVSLLAMSKTSQHLAVQHTRAVILSDAIIERIRANPRAIATYNLGLSKPVGGKSQGVAEPSPNCRTDDCGTDALATHDLWVWEQALNGAGATVDGAPTSGLKDPHGCIVFTAAPGHARTGQLTVYIQWRGLTESYDAVQGNEKTCGGAKAGDDNTRRQVVVNTYVLDSAEL
jgi:type IV pilus assembly protein PilV